ncbi:MAG: hypothetical protein ABW321_11475 [Polyangiales bacterium]
MANAPDPQPQQPTYIVIPSVATAQPMPVIASPAVYAAPQQTAPVAAAPAPRRGGSLSFGAIFTFLLLLAVIALPMYGEPLFHDITGAAAGAHDDTLVESNVAPRQRTSDASLRTTYRGETVYYLDGHWYTHRGQAWAYYRDEPDALLRYRREQSVERTRPRYDDRRDREYDANRSNVEDEQYRARRMATPF